MEDDFVGSPSVLISLGLQVGQMILQIIFVDVQNWENDLFLKNDGQCLVIN